MPKNNVEINRNFVKIARSAPDLTTAKLNLSEAEVMALEAENNYYNARVDLNNSMYLDSQPDYKIKNTPTFDFDNDYAYSVAVRELKPYEKYTFPFSRENAVQLAYDNSPDLWF